MGMTMTQKILAAHAGLDKVEAGQLIRADLDMVLGNDITTPVAVNEQGYKSSRTVHEVQDFCKEIRREELLRRRQDGYRACAPS